MYTVDIGFNEGTVRNYGNWTYWSCVLRLLAEKRCVVCCRWIKV